MTTCRVRLQPEAGYTRLTPVCGNLAKGEMPDGTPACGVHLRSKTALTIHAADEFEDTTTTWTSAPETPDRRGDRILWNVRDKDIDEIVMHDVTVHIEQMYDRCWWIGLYFGDDPDHYWMGNFTCDSRGRMRFTEQENAGVEWADDRSHEEPR